MAQYCSRCKELHHDDEMCPHYARQLKKHPELLGEAAKFTSIAAQYNLTSSQTLNTIAQGVNKVVGSNLTYEGTHQFARDIQVFKQLNVDGFCKSGVFSNAQNAQNYLNNGTKGQLDFLTKKLNGTGQEVDWLRLRQGQFSSLLEKSKLLGEEVTNAPGIDGVTINRFTGRTVERTTIKAVQDSKNLGTNVRDVLKALDKGTLNPDDTLVGIDGTRDALVKALEKNIKNATESGNVDYANKLKQAQEQLRIKELNNYNDVKESTKRLTDKISNGQAHSTVTMKELSKKSCQGAVVGAAVNLTISSITNYLKYRNGEITESEAINEIGEDTLKGALTGSAMAGITVFLPGGPLGFVAGMGIGIYVNATCTNMLDEIYGKGAFAAILDASGFVYGTTVNLSDYIDKIEKDQKKIAMNTSSIRRKSAAIDKNFDEFEQIMKG